MVLEPDDGAEAGKTSRTLVAKAGGTPKGLLVILRGFDSNCYWSCSWRVSSTPVPDLDDKVLDLEPNLRAAWVLVHYHGWEFGASLERVNVFLHREEMWIINGQRMDCGRLTMTTNSLIPLHWGWGIYPRTLLKSRLASWFSLINRIKYGRSDVKPLVEPNQAIRYSSYILLKWRLWEPWIPNYPDRGYM